MNSSSALSRGRALKAAFLLKTGERIRLYPHKIALYRGRLYLETRHVAVVVDSVEERLMVDAEMGPDEALLKLGQHGIVEKGDLKEEILVERLLVDAELAARRDRRPRCRRPCRCRGCASARRARRYGGRLRGCCRRNR